jgi:hypothetical protein
MRGIQYSSSSSERDNDGEKFLVDSMVTASRAEAGDASERHTPNSLL